MSEDPQPKKAKDMSPAEREAAILEIKRAARTFPPIDMTKTAKDMSPAEQEAFVREVKRRFE